MSDQSLVPFLSEFFEPRESAAGSALGTETFTKTANESGDSDAAHERQRGARTRAAAMGTETLTEVRTENSDTDEPRRSRAAVLGTQTATATHEQTDDDRIVVARSAALGTETFTRAQEGNDTDVSRASSTPMMFGATVI
jgi:hypothetical protein